MTTSEQIDQIGTALAKAQASMKNAPLNKTNPHFKSKFADLASVRDAVVPALSANGIAVAQAIDVSTELNMCLRTRLIHASGQWIESLCPIPASTDMQKMGSALTYARRYSLSAICGIAADEDDDGNDASGKGKAQEPIVATAPTIHPAVMAALPEGCVYIVRVAVTAWGGDITVVDAQGVETTHKTTERRTAELCEQIVQEGTPVTLDLQPITRGKNAGKVKLAAVHRWTQP